MSTEPGFQQQIDNLLIDALAIGARFDLESLKRKDKFSEEGPTRPTVKEVDWESLKKTGDYPEEPPLRPSSVTYGNISEYPPKPDRGSSEFTPSFTFFDKLIQSKKAKKIQEAENRYLAAISEWERQKHAIDEFNTDQSNKAFQAEIEKWEIAYADWEKRRKNFLQDQVIYNAKIDDRFKRYISKASKSELAWTRAVAKWEKRKSSFLEEQANFNLQIDKLRDSYLSKNPASIAEYCELVLKNSKYPNTFPKAFQLEYIPENETLIIEYELPGIDCFPKVKGVKS